MARQEDVSVQFYQKKLEADSQSLVFSRLADCYRKKGEIQQAIGVCMQGLQIHPDYVTGRVILGRCYLEQEKLKEATMEFVHVIEIDRRNQVAVKMLADVYARQGMKEKAGDLYAYLLRMDPDNQSLTKLAQANRGNGETNVMRVLGIAPGTLDRDASASLDQQEPEVSQGPPDLSNTQTSFDTITDVDKTIQMDIVSRQPEGRLGDTAELGEMLVKTQKFDTEELNAAADAGASDAGASDARTYRVEETISDIGTKQGDADGGAITGDDISSRMAMIFGDEQAGEPHPGETASESTDVVTGNADASSAAVDHEETIAAGSIDSKEPLGAPALSGSDITSRIEQLFGDEQSSAKPDPGNAAASDFTQASVPGPLAEAAEDTAASVSAQKQVDSGDISAKDVTDRLNEMFSDSASSITEPLAEIGKMLDLRASGVEDEVPAAAAGEVPGDQPTESIDMDDRLAAAGNLNEPESSLGDSAEAISGDDVALRLDTIFEEGEKAGATSEMEAVAVHDDTLLRPEEDTRPPVEISDHAIIIGGDSSDSDIHEQGEATLFGAETLTEDQNEQASISAPEAVDGGPELSIDDTVAPEMQPELSGNDVVGRLEELFSDNLTSGGLDSIPDGDKDDGEVNQGFYTMSGENAQTAPREDTLLSELDKSYSGDPEKDTPDIPLDAGDRTVLMEQDDRDITLAASDDETILASRNEPLPGQPDPSTASAGAEGPVTDGEDVLVNEATQIRLPTVDDRTPAEADAQYSIPDHVLTPTLADIYFQQGQPKLALQIYNRLLDSDPDNERVATRVREIERFIAAQETEETAVVDRKRPVLSGAIEEKMPHQKKSGGVKPLSGVRIKKVYKNRIKKSR